MCRVEDIIVEGLIEGSVVHFHRARTVVVHSSGLISTSGLGKCRPVSCDHEEYLLLRVLVECALTCCCALICMFVQI